VLSHYNLGVINEARILDAGSRRSPKMLLEAEKGRFLLKRRPRGIDDYRRVRFAHLVQQHLAAKGFPVPALVPGHPDGTVLQIEKHIYECFEYCDGSRCDGSPAQTEEAGMQLARLHLLMRDFVFSGRPPTGSFHDSSTVRKRLKAFTTSRTGQTGRPLRKAAEGLLVLYNTSSTGANQQGYDDWNKDIVHGDWHPGNMLFGNERLEAVLDFDCARVAPAQTDLANGILQFSILARGNKPANWPENLEMERFKRFASGYLRERKFDDNGLKAIPDLMIEALIAEAVLPVAATGFVGHLRGAEFLGMVRRKASWISENRGLLINSLHA
jgi:Ser/Thr protein kinase RdoA (MazF antagonist)